MNPFKTALWIAKFVGSLALLLVVIPYGLFIGGTWTVGKVTEKYQEHRFQVFMREVDACVKKSTLTFPCGPTCDASDQADRVEEIRNACNTSPANPTISPPLPAGLTRYRPDTPPCEVPSTALALNPDVAILRNGFSIRHEKRQMIGPTTRLYMGDDPCVFVDVSTDQIDHFESDHNFQRLRKQEK